MGDSPYHRSSASRGKNDEKLFIYLFQIRFFFIYQMVDVLIHHEIQVHFHRCAPEMAIVVEILFHQLIISVQA